MNGSFARFAGWSAYISAVAAILAFATTILFYGGARAVEVIGIRIGTWNDYCFLVELLSMLPLPFAVYQLSHDNAPRLRRAAAIFGVTGTFVMAIVWALMLLKVLSVYDVIDRFFWWAGVLIGAWLFLVNYPAIRKSEFSQTLVWSGIVAGVGYMLLAGYTFGGESNPFFIIGALMNGIGYPIWAIWLGRLLLARRVAVAAA